MISIVLNDKSNNKETRVELSFKEFFEKSPQFKGLSLDEAREHFNYSMIEFDHLVLSLNVDNFTINFSNLPVRNIFNLNYELAEGKSIFDIYTSFKLVGFEKILSTLKIGESKKFNYFIFDDNRLVHYYLITIYRSENSILFASSKNFSYEMFTNKQRLLDSLDEGIIIIENDSIVFVNAVSEKLFSISKDEFCKLKLDEFLNDFDSVCDFKKAINDIKKGYSISQSFYITEEINGEIRHFNVFCSSYIYKSNPSIHIRIMDRDDADLVKEINFKNQNDLQMLRSFANIASFMQDDSTNEIRWSSEVGSVLGMFPPCVSLQEDLFKYIVPEDKANFEKTWVNAIISKRDVITEFSIRNLEGELKHLYLFAKLVYSPKGNIIKIKGFIQDISKIVDYKAKYKASKNIKAIPLKTVYHSGELLANLLLNLAEKEYKLTNDSLEVLEKTQNRLRAIQFVYKMLANSAKFKINLKTFFDKYIKAVHMFYDIDHVDLDWEISRDFVDSKLIFILAFSVNEILAEILKYTSPQVIETIRVNISKEKNIINLLIWTDLIFYSKEEIEEEFFILKYILKKYNFNDYKIEVNDEGTFFNINIE